MWRQVMLWACVGVVMMGVMVGGEACYTCGTYGNNNGFTIASSLANAGSFANSRGNGYAQSQANSHASSFANSRANSHGNGHASSFANSRASSFANSNANNHASSQANSYANSQANSHANSGIRGYLGHPTSCPGCGCGGCDGSCGWCGGNFSRRKRRSTENFLESPEIHQVYEQIVAEDQNECGLRLVCELAQKDPRDLMEDEVQILLPYSGAGESDGTVYGSYDEAVWHGQEGHGCQALYNRCAFNAHDIMTDYRNYKLGILEQPE